ncbi:outer membrane beta-barrel protein [Haloflavibacter putidus]|uniref:Outer membrane beta-barrel protein n=1 Tax=Haloflavibacter putidus TaxID=2576776 RepID=A0A507ZVL6_9FLAO|nr:outer membrane beta-barrel protein [Haloflavibacter putidus]TQD40641.1 outer membrane beta-barrel protein [Haloflavibacter putidus]
MSDKKNIDRVYQEQFKDFESAPREQVWKNIEHKLKNKQKRKVILIPLWYKIAGVAALVAIAFFIGKNFFYTSPNTQNSVSNSPTKPIEAEDNKELQKEDFKEVSIQNKNSLSAQSDQQKINKKQDNNKLKAQTKQQKSYKNQDNSRLVNASNNSGKAINPTSSIAVSEQKENSNSVNKNAQEKQNNPTNINTLAGNVLKDNKTQEKPNYFAGQNRNQNFEQDKKAIISLNKNNLFQSALAKKSDSLSTAKNTLVAETETPTKGKSLVEAAKEIQDETKENSERSEETETAVATSKWQIKPSVAPVYYGGLDGGNAIDHSFSQNSSEGEISTAYGINLAYTFAKRWKIRSGIGKVNLSYNVNNIAYNSTVNARNVGALQNHSKNITVLSKKPMVESAMTEVQSKIAEFKMGTLNQKIGYITLPVEVEYALVDKRFAINLIGGASTMFLDDNQININSAEGTIKLGESANLNNLSFSTNLGLGLGYELNKKFDLNLEPTFNYQINTFSDNANGFKPYYFGVYTGFSFKF